MLENSHAHLIQVQGTVSAGMVVGAQLFRVVEWVDGGVRKALFESGSDSYTSVQVVDRC